MQETETLHMECKETGEFAHRETTEFTQKETFNKEVVSEQGGMEEYVHLKSLEDEIEFMERCVGGVLGVLGDIHGGVGKG